MRGTSGEVVRGEGHLALGGLPGVLAEAELAGGVVAVLRRAGVGRAPLHELAERVVGVGRGLPLRRPHLPLLPQRVVVEVRHGLVSRAVAGHRADGVSEGVGVRPRFVVLLIGRLGEPVRAGAAAPREREGLDAVAGANPVGLIGDPLRQHHADAPERVVVVPGLGEGAVVRGRPRRAVVVPLRFVLVIPAVDVARVVDLVRPPPPPDPPERIVVGRRDDHLRAVVLLRLDLASEPVEVRRRRQDRPPAPVRLRDDAVGAPVVEVPERPTSPRRAGIVVGVLEEGLARAVLNEGEPPEVVVVVAGDRPAFVLGHGDGAPARVVVVLDREVACAGGASGEAARGGEVGVLETGGGAVEVGAVVAVVEPGAASEPVAELGEVAVPVEGEVFGSELPRSAGVLGGRPRGERGRRGGQRPAALLPAVDAVGLPERAAPA